MLIGISGKIGTGKDTIGAIIRYLVWKKEVEAGDITGLYHTLQDFIDGRGAPSGWEIKKFAGKLKEIVALLTGCKVSDLESQEFKAKYLSEEWVKGSERTCGGIPTYRWLLQKIGTEALRDMIHENVWVNALFADYKPKYFPSSFPPAATQEEYITQQGYPNWIITDMRFPNEAEAIRERTGLLLRVERIPFTVHHSKTGEAHDLSREAFTEHPSETGLDNYHGFDYTILNNGTIDDLVKNVETILRAEGII